MAALASAPGSFSLTGVQSDCHSSVQMHIEARDLVDLDTFSLSDPFAVVYMTDSKGMREIGRTETVRESLNPDFATGFDLDYFFEERQTITLRLYDDDGKGKVSDLKRHDFLGEASFGLAEAMHSPSGSLTKVLQKIKKGSVTVFVEVPPLRPPPV